MLIKSYFRSTLILLVQQHAILINQVQAPEDAAAQQTRRIPTPVQNAAAPTTDGAQPELPLPATALPRPTGPTFFQLVIRHLRSDPQARICTCSHCLCSFLWQIC